MRIYLTFLLLFLTVIATNAQGDFANLDRYRAANEALPAPTDAEQRIVFLGNSITEGWVREDSAFFADNNFVGRGISGQTSPQLLLRFRQDVIDLRPLAVVIHIGTNDVAENTGPYDPDFTVGNIRSMVELAQANDIEVILAAVVPSTAFSWRPEVGDRSDLIVELNQRIAELAAEKNARFVDYHAALRNADNGMDAELAKDGVHPTKRGFEVMKGLVMVAVAEVRGF